MSKPITRAEALKIYKRFGIVHDILMEPYHNPKFGEALKEIIKKSNDERKES